MGIKRVMAKATATVLLGTVALSGTTAPAQADTAKGFGVTTSCEQPMFPLVYGHYPIWAEPSTRGSLLEVRFKLFHWKSNKWQYVSVSEWGTATVDASGFLSSRFLTSAGFQSAYAFDAQRGYNRLAVEYRQVEFGTRRVLDSGYEWVNAGQAYDCYWR